MNLFIVGLSYRTAPVAIRERLAITPSRLKCLGCRLKLAGELEELVLLSTCNRVEVYGVGPSFAGRAKRFFQLLSSDPGFDFSPYLYAKKGLEAVKHLFSVAAGLDSMVLGETEITGQVKQCYLASAAAGLTGKVTNRLFQTALQTAKAVRSQTAIGRGATSVGSVAVELAERIFDQDLSGRTVMIIGAGKMGEACVKHLAKKGPRSILVANRSLPRAQSLATEFGGEAVCYEDCLKAMTRADIVVTSTGAPHVILRRDDVESLMRARRNRPLFLIDIAVPRDIEPAVEELRNVYLYNVDHLEAIVRENVKQRQQELDTCLAMIAERAEALLARIQAASVRTSNAGSLWPAGIAEAST